MRVHRKRARPLLLAGCRLALRRRMDFAQGAATLAPHPPGQTTAMHQDDSNRNLLERLVDARDGAVRSFREFLRIPTFMVLGFLLLAIVLYTLDRGDYAWLAPVREVLKTHLFLDPDTTSDFLAAIAAGIISVTSITISLLLLAVQQSAGSMTSAVFDQFLRRRRNQAYFGYFIGLALYCLIMLSTVNDSANGVLGATAGFVLTLIALYLIVVLLYSTINQMRPAVIVGAIHGHILHARRRQLPLVHRTRRAALNPVGDCTTVESERSGYITRIHLDALESGLEGIDASVEIELLVSIGSYVACHDGLARIRGGTAEVREKLASAVRKALVIERLRGMDGDPGYGMGQMSRIAWTTISTAKSSPGPAGHAIRALRDLLARWAREPVADPEVTVLPVVYQDTLFRELVEALETAAVAASESRQHQSLAEILRVFVSTARRQRPPQQKALVELVERIIPTLADHVLTLDLCNAMRETAATLAECGHPHVAERMTAVKDRLGRRLDDVCR